MINSATCPRCDSRIWPEPFIGRVMGLCPHCDGQIVLSTDGVSFEMSRIRATLPVNGECQHLTMCGVET